MSHLFWACPQTNSSLGRRMEFKLWKKASPSPSTFAYLRQKTCLWWWGVSPDSFPTRKLKYLLQAVMEDIRTTHEIIQCPSPLHGIMHYPPGFTFKVGVLPTLRPGSFEIPRPELLSGGAWQVFPGSPREGAQHQKHNRDFQGGQSLSRHFTPCVSQSIAVPSSLLQGLWVGKTEGAVSCFHPATFSVQL